MQKSALIDLGLLDLAILYGLLLLVIGLARRNRFGQEKEMLVASVRMFVQLLAVGYVLKVIFAIDQAWAVMLILVLMLVIAVQMTVARVQQRMPGIYRIVASALFLGCGCTTFIFCGLIIGLSPWYDPRYLIPLAGMIIGNSMTGSSLAAERLTAEINDRREEIETALSLGVSSLRAARPAVHSAFRAALIPTVNAMAAMGIVFLPGMMTGQILSGTEPLLAVRYQIAIMCVITISVALTSCLIVWQGVRSFFTENHQLRE
ncbi:MAG: iron export ABC transporter permease subunit FetB [Desulfuromonas sp.]|nr:MAG: iron export ABC transporter permease subunit FetB [Desulfuromonas sp.]